MKLTSSNPFIYKKCQKKKWQIIFSFNRDSLLDKSHIICISYDKLNCYVPAKKGNAELSEKQKPVPKTFTIKPMTANKT